MTRKNYRVTHYISIGTSIPRNYLRTATQCIINTSSCPIKSREKELEEDVKLLDACLNIPPGAPREYECLKSLSGWTSLHERVLEFVRKDPRRASAELNAAHPWLDNPGKYVAKVYLYATETGAGLLASNVLKRYFSEVIGGNVELRLVPGFQLSLWKGLRDLTRKLAEDLAWEKRDLDTLHLLNLTGGFKVESAYMMLTGLREVGDRGFALYIHEAQRSPLLVPLAFAIGGRLGIGEALRSRASLPGPRSGCGEGDYSVIRLEDSPEPLVMFAFLGEPLGVSCVRDGLVYLRSDVRELLEEL